MTPAVQQLSAALAVELKANAEPPADPKSIPLRFHQLKQMQRSPAHCHHAMRWDGEPSLAKRIGSAVHSLILGGPPVVTFPGKVRNGKVWDAFKEEHAGSIIVSAKEADRAKRINDAVRSNPVASRVLYGDGFVYEQPILWDMDGRACRSTPDVRSWRHLVDLKSCRSAEPEKFMWDAVRMGYHAQLAMYREAIWQGEQRKISDVYIVAVESSAPYTVVVRRVTNQSLEVGWRLVKGWFARFAACEASDHWPGYAEEVVDMDVPLEPIDLIFGDDTDADGDDE